MQDQLHIRPYQESSDLGELRSIVNVIIESGEAFVYNKPFTTDQMRDWLNAFSAAFVATTESDPKRIVGGYVLKPNQLGRGSHVCNAAYMVAANARGLGVGKALGEHSLIEARRLGFSSMQFNAVVSSNKAAVELWKKLGFAIIGEVPEGFARSNGERVALYIMYRNLN